MEELAAQTDGLLSNLDLGPYQTAVLIVIIGIVIAKLADLILVGFAAKIISRTRNRFDDQILGLLHKPLFTSFATLGLMIATYQLQDEIAPDLMSVVVAILKTIVIFSWLRFFISAAGAIFQTMQASPNHFGFAQRDTVPLFKNLAIVFLLLAGAYAILIAWDINVTGLVASAGIVGLALSFAAQDTLSHLFAGVAILADRPYRIGDFIVLDTGERGMVTNIGLRSTRLMTRDDVEISIPNGVMGAAKIINETSGVQRFRIRAAVGVAYGSDVEKVLHILEEIALDNENIEKDPSPRARFRAFGASSLDFELLAWIRDPALRGLRIHEINIEINRRFQEAGVVIPFPQHDIWIKELPKRPEE